MNKTLKTIAYYFLQPLVLLCILLGYGVFYITKPLRALSHLMLGNFSTAKSEIKDWRIYTDITDAL